MHKLTIEKFGCVFIETNDIEPVYNALVDANLGSVQTKRWIIAFLCYYHAGVSSWISEQEDFWAVMWEAAVNKTTSPVGGLWPRNNQRRHFRAKNACDSIEYMTLRWPNPEDMIDELASLAPNFRRIRSAVKKIPSFGDLFAFKTADLLERCIAVPIDFTVDDIFLFQSIVDGANLVARQLLGVEYPTDTDRRVVVDTLLQYYQHLKAPPTYDRPIGLQEVETILCTWKNYDKGVYPLGYDMKELIMDLTKWSPVSPTATKLLEVAPTWTEGMEL